MDPIQEHIERTRREFLTTTASGLGMMALGGMAWWKAWLSKKIEVRQKSIQKEMPFCLDLLTLAMEAGLDFTAALARIGQKVPPSSPLGQEFAMMQNRRL